MRQLTTIKSIRLHDLNTSEYVNLMSRFLELAEKATPAALGIGEEEFEEFKALAAQMLARVGHSAASALTPQLQSLDKGRKSLFAYLRKTVQAGTKLPIEEKSQPAEALLPYFLPCKGLDKLPLQSVTVRLGGLAEELASEEARAHVAALGLTAIAGELAETNRRYAKLTDQRTAENGRKTGGSGMEIRPLLDQAYTTLTLLAQSASIHAPSAAAAEFVRHLNATIEEIATLNRIRLSAAKRARKERGENTGK